MSRSQPRCDAMCPRQIVYDRSRGTTSCGKDEIQHTDVDRATVVRRLSSTAAYMDVIRDWAWHAWPCARPVDHGQERRRQRSRSKSNMSKRSPIAGMLTGTYGLPPAVMGLGRLSRVRAVSGFKRQLRSMNFSTDAWSP